MITRLLVALDGSPRSPGVFEVAAELAIRFEATVHPFRAIFVPPEFPAAAGGSLHDLLPEHLLKTALGELRNLARPRHGLVVALPIVRVGPPWKCIIETADELEVDVIVIGSHGYRGLDYVLGTTASQVANRAHRNVLVVHGRSDDSARATTPSGSPSSSAGG